MADIVNVIAVGVAAIVRLKILVEIMDIGIVCGTADSAPVIPVGAAAIAQLKMLVAGMEVGEVL